MSYISELIVNEIYYEGIIEEGNEILFLGSVVIVMLIVKIKGCILF